MNIFLLINMKSKNNDPLQHFEPIDESKSFFFQLKVWENSCSLRYLPESLFTIFLVVNYNLFLYTLSIKKVEYAGTQKDYFVKSFYFYMFFYQVICINVNIIYQYVFSFVSDRKTSVNYWNYLEILLLILSLLTFIDFRMIFKDNVDEKYGEFILISILCLLDIATWTRIAGILLTWKNLGPVIKMIYLMALLLLKYIFIYSVFIVCMSAVFTAILFGSSNQFYNMTTSLISLISPYIQNFDTENFHQNKLLGQIMLMVYTSITGIMLINLLIAVLSNVYDELSKQVDASHRAVLITYHRKFQWNSEYGYIIFLPNPLNICNIIVFPIQLLIGTKNKERQMKFNKLICKIYFLIFYFPIILCIFIIYTVMIYPF